MKAKVRKLAVSLTALLTAVCGVLGAGALRVDESVSASADNAAMTVGTLGNLSWEEVSGATGYAWSYTIGTEKSETYFSESNEVNAGIALTKAAKAAVALNKDDNADNDVSEATVQFSVTAQGVADAAEMAYTHKFSQYIDYSYATHDFADVKAQAAGATRLSELTLDGSFANWISSAMFKNDVLTIGMRVDEELDDEGLTFALFGAYTTTKSNYNYRISQKMDGSIVWYIKGTANTAIVAGTNYNAPLELGKSYYLSMAVLDTYDITGAVVGETVYYARSEYDETTDSLKEVGGFSQLVASATVTSKGLTYKTTPIVMIKNKQKMEVDISALYVYTNGHDDGAYVFSGIPMYEGAEAPSAVYYDNVDATMNWNNVSGATAYEYKIGDGAWETTAGRKVSVESALTTYKEIGYLPFYVRAVGGKTACYNLDLTRFYKTRSTVMDYTDVCAGTKSTGNNAFSTFSTLSTKVSAHGISGYSYLNTKLKYGMQVATKLKMTGEGSYSTRFYSMGLFGTATGSNSSSGVAYERYFVSLYGDGTVSLAVADAAWTTGTGTNNRTRKDFYWRLQNITDKFMLGYTYYLTYGIDEVYEYDETAGEDVLVAHRITARIEMQKDGGLDREVLGIVTYDNEKYATEGYTLESNPTVRVKASDSYCDLYKAVSDTNHAITFVTSSGELIATKTVDFGAYYDFTDVEKSFTVPEGYIFNGWTYQTSKGAIKPFELTGYYNTTVSNALSGGAITVTANLEATAEPTCKVIVHYGNAQKLTLEKAEGTTLTESDLPTMPEGYQFGGVYLDSTYETAYDLSTEITENVNVYVKWIPVIIQQVKPDDTDVPSTDKPSTDEPATENPPAEDPIDEFLTGCIANAPASGIALAVAMVGVACLCLTKKRKLD